MDTWKTALDGFDVSTIAPRPVPPHLGFATPAAALAHACGPPATAPDTPLVVAVNDPARATRTAPALRALREACGARPFLVLVATGSHRFSRDAEAAHEATLADAAGHPTTFHWHDARSPDLRPVGSVRMNAHLAAARDVVAIGSVEPHWFAGLTGGYKTLAVGLLARDDIQANHRLALSDGARPLALRGNPVFDGLETIVDSLAEGRALLALQHIEDRWFGGPPLDLVRACHAAAQTRWGHTPDGPLDFVVARIRPPLDASLYQAEKGIKHTEHAVRDGGAIVTDARCVEGVGPDRFVDLLSRAPDEATARALVQGDGYRLGDHKAVRLRALQGRGVRLALVAPTFPPDAAAAAGIAIVDDAPAAAAWLRGAVGSGASGALVEDAGHTVLEAR